MGSPHAAWIDAAWIGTRGFRQASSFEQNGIPVASSGAKALSEPREKIAPRLPI
jgi:hypothetical protein